MKRVVITGMGIVSPIGIGREAFIQGLNEKVPEATPITLFDTEHCQCKEALELIDFDCTQYIEKRGLRTMDRNTKIALTGTQLAIEDAGLQEFDLTTAGMVMGTMFGSVSSIRSFDLKILESGPLSVNPMLFPNTVINFPTSQVNIRYGMNGMSTTISSGQAASLDALGAAFQAIRAGAIDLVFAGGSEELSEESYQALDNYGALSAEAHPFHKGSVGVKVGEGAAIFVLEELNHAKERGANIIAEITGYTNTFEANGTAHQGEAYKRSIESTLEEANLTTKEIDSFYSGAGGHTLQDAIEANQLSQLFDQEKTDIFSVKHYLGESFGASGGLSAAAALCEMTENVRPEMIRQDDEESDNYWIAPKQSTEKSAPKNCLIGAMGFYGNNASLLLQKY